MNPTNDSIGQLQRANRWLRRCCVVLAGAVILGAGMAMQAGLDRDGDTRNIDLIEDSQAVSDPDGFAVFVRRDGNVVIVKEDGTIIRTNNQPMLIGF
jgi:hypothetical protein